MSAEDEARSARELRKRARELRRRIAEAGTTAVPLADADRASAEAEELGAVVERGTVRDGVPAGRLLDEAALLLTLAYKQAGQRLDDLGDTPDLPGRRQAGEISARRGHVLDDGTELVASPGETPETPHYFPGGRFRGRAIPEGHYSTAFWHDVEAGATAAGAGIVWGAAATGFMTHVLPGSGSGGGLTWEIASDHLTALPSGGGGSFLDLPDLL